MKPGPTIFVARRQRRAGLTLLEILVSVALLVVIVLGLTAMFNQTQRAFRSGLVNVDVMEGGRSAVELIGREMEQMEPSHRPFGTNFFSELQQGGGTFSPIVLTIPGGNTPPFTNFLDRVFFVNRSDAGNRTDEWYGRGFRVLDTNNFNDSSGVLVGTLYRFDASTTTNLGVETLKRGFDNPPQDLIDNKFLHRIIDGVVHFQMKVFDVNGREYGLAGASNTVPYITYDNIYGIPELAFVNDRLPAYVELELGIIEPQVYLQVKPLLAANRALALNFLNTHANKIHYFRQQIPIRTARQ